MDGTAMTLLLADDEDGRMITEAALQKARPANDSRTVAEGVDG